MLKVNFFIKKLLNIQEIKSKTKKIQELWAALETKLIHDWVALNLKKEYHSKEFFCSKIDEIGKLEQEIFDLQKVSLASKPE